MDHKHKEKIKAAILERIKELKVDIASLEEYADPIEPDRALGRITRMDAMHTQSIQDNNLNAAKGNLCKLEHALKLIDHPQFGMCSYCKNPIGMERLLFMPETNKCVKCAEKFR